MPIKSNKKAVELKVETLNGGELSANMASIEGAVSVVEYILPSVNKLLEDNILLLSESLTNVASQSKKLQKYIRENASIDKAEIEKFAGEISDGASGAIVGIQFQDRVSQNLVIACDIANKISKFLSDNFQKIDGNLNKDFAKDILDLIKLGEIRDKYIDNLKTKNLIKDASEIGFVPNANASSASSDEVELF